MIDNAKEGINFNSFGKGVSDEWLQRAETRLGIKFPPSYVWWLKNYGGGEIHGQELYSIYEEDFNTVVGGDIVYINELNVSKGLFSKDQLVVCQSDLDVIYYFDTTKRDENSEMPIYEYFSKNKVADNFIELLKKMILGEA